ncbi:MAG TPA: nitroreductase family deazaflavin-dependent oxidoreductase [Pseudonocardiaceae bacterium]
MTSNDQPAEQGQHYVRPTRSTAVFNSIVAGLAKAGVNLYGAQVLSVRGRTSGEMRSNPVNPLAFQGERYLVAARGQTQWVRNLRAAGEGELRRGRRVERFTAVELPDDDKPNLLRHYLKKWKFEVGMFFDGVDANASDETLRQIAPRHPIFRITTAK